MLFSATMPGPVVTLARRYLRHPTHVRAESDDDTLTVPNTASSSSAPTTWTSPRCSPASCRPTGAAWRWCSPAPSGSADRIAADLDERGFAAAAVHGDLGQGAREQALRAFRSGKVDILVATDVAARGIDVAGVTHVINYECPDDEKTYLHRIGRTGRAGETGVAVTFVDWADGYRWGMINKALDLPFPEPDGDLLDLRRSSTRSSTSRASATGRLPRAQRTRDGPGRRGGRGPRRDRPQAGEPIGRAGGSGARPRSAA